MNKSYRKNILRTFKSTRSRFIAIFSIVALGVGFLAGLSATPVDMRNSMERYMDSGNFYDLRVLSTLGLTDEDVQALSRVEGVRQVEAAYSADLLVQAGGADVVVARAHSIPREINVLTLVEGRLPERRGECVVEAGANDVNRAFDIGQKFFLTEDNEDLEEKMAATEFTVVGVVHNTNYFSFEREPASVGNGTINLVFYVEPEDFAYESYTEIYLTADGALEQSSLEDDYEETVRKLSERVESISDEQCRKRYNTLRTDAQAEIDRAWQEYEDARTEADEKLADAWQEILDGRKKLADGEQELADGEREYEDGLKEVADAEKEVSDGQDALQKAEDQLIEGQAAWDDGWRKFKDGETTLAEAKKELEEGQRKYDDGLAAYQISVAQLQAGELQLAEAKQKLDAAQTLYGEGKAQLEAKRPFVEAARGQYEQLAALNAGYKQYRAGVEAIIGQYAALGIAITFEQAEETFSDKALAAMLASTPESAMTPEELVRYQQLLALNTAQKQIDAGIAGIMAAATPETGMTREQAIAVFSDEALAKMLPQVEQAEAQLAAAEEQLALSGVQLEAGWAEYNANAQKMAEGRAALQAAGKQLESAKMQLEAGWAAYNAGGDELYAGKHTLEKTRTELQDGWAVLADKKVELANAQKKIRDARQDLVQARQELADARETIAENRQKLLDGEIEYEDAKAEAEQKLADAKQEIEDGQKKLDDLEVPEWYVWDRSHNVSWASFDGNVEKLQAITTVFPVFFFLVAALVVSTTMTRMIEEERLQIGTMKALGYRKQEILVKYMLYALTAAVAGTFVGLAVGFYAFPTIIWSAYSMMYYMPKIYAPWLLDKALTAGGALIGLSILVTVTAGRATLAESPAALMLPRAPKPGKRILLEYITPLWKRLPFSWKVTCRNLLRYQKRFWMTVIGVAGCTALLVTGFGIADSLDAIITNQYDRVYHYDLTTVLSHPEDTQAGEAYEYLFGSDFDASLVTCTEKVNQTDPNGKQIECYLTVPKDIDSFADFADLHERVSGIATPMQQEGVVLTEKFASLMGVKTGDTVRLANVDGAEAEFMVSGVCEHYVYNYAYLSATAYENGFGAAPEWNTVLTKLKENTQESRDKASARLLAMDEVAGISFTVDQINMVLNMLNSINAVVVLIVVCAAALAFVVLYNLSNINIAERVKEIATIKVLGFHDKEVSAYVNRETVVLTVIGALTGLVMGIWLHRFIMITVEVDAVMFGRDIAPRSFLFALILTLLFGTVVNLVMGRKLRRISMVESMKAPE